MQNRHEKIAELIRERLFALPDPTHDRITENDLVDQFGVSRTPVREALKILEVEGLVERRKNRGISLRKPSLQEMVEMYDLRSVLEGFAGRVAAQAATPKELGVLARLAARHSKAGARGDVAESARVDQEFHHAVVVLARNALLLRVMRSFSLQRQTFLRWHGDDLAPAARTSPYTHERIVAALRARSADDTEALLRAHTQWAKQYLIERAMGIQMDPLGSQGRFTTVDE